MRTESFKSWLNSLDEVEREKYEAEYGPDNMKQAYYDLLATLSDDFIIEYEIKDKR